MKAEGLAEFAQLLLEPALVVERDGRIFTSNDAAVNLLHVDRSELESNRLHDFADPDAVSSILEDSRRSSAPVLAALHVQIASERVRQRVESTTVHFDDGRTLALIRLRSPSLASGRFTALNATVSGLEAEVDKRVRMEGRLEGQLQLLSRIATGTPLSEMLDAIATFTESESENDIYVSVLFVREDRLALAAGPSLPAEFCSALDGTDIGPSAGACGTAAYSKSTIVCSNIAVDPKWRDFMELAEKFRLRSCFSMPVLSQGGAVDACVAVYYRRPRRPSADDRRLCSLAVHLVQIALQRHQSEQELLARATRLAELDERKNEFLAMLGHELRNPLSSMVTATELLRTAGDDEDARSEWLVVLDRKLALMRRLVDDLLDIARVTRGNIELRPRPLDLRDVVEPIALAAQAKVSQLRVDLPQTPVRVHADIDRVQQIIENLLHNATKYTPSDGQIEVILRESGEEALLLIKDTGEGIGPDILPHVFDLFVQGEKPIDRIGGGLGIGLTLVRGLAVRHGGSVHARSDGPGLGSEFELRLPLIISGSDGDQQQLSTSVSDTKAESGGLEILLVDDDEDSCDLLATLLTSWGHTIEAAHNGLDALDAAISKVPQFVLLDIGLPGLDGYEVARRLRASTIPHDAPCTLVALTGYGLQADMQRAKAAGFDHFLVKPVDLEELKQLIESTRARYQL